MERANLIERLPELYDRLIQEWADWNATILPEIDASYTFSFAGAALADHIGTPEANHKADNPRPPAAPHR